MRTTAPPVGLTELLSGRNVRASRVKGDRKAGFQIGRNYSIFDSTLYKNLDAKWLFSQEKATLHDVAMSLGESKML